MENFKKLENYIKENYSIIYGTDGENCKKCPKMKMCKFVQKQKHIDFVLNTPDNDTKYPHILKLVKRHNNLLKLIPYKLYALKYGAPKDPVTGCPFSSKKIIDNLDKIKIVYGMLDNESKFVYYSLLMTKLSCDLNYVKCARSKNDQYFIGDFCNLDSKEVYVDCGAFTGDTFDNYLKHNNTPKACYLFEPDFDNYVKLKADSNLNGNNLECHIINKGVGDSVNKLWLDSGLGECCHIVDNIQDPSNKVKIEITTLDDEIKEPVTFLKMDIEGFEQQALKGAENHIKNDTPKLAICIYHKIEDFWEIPLMIKEMNPKYNKFRVEHYTDYVGETVFYAYCK